METKDQRIDEALKKIEAKLAELEQNKPGSYTFRTNCSYFDVRGGKGVNLKTLELNELIRVYTQLKIFEQGVTSAVAELSASGVDIDVTSFNGKIPGFGGYSIDDFKGDILFLIKKSKWISEVDELKTKREKLEKLYSQEKKDNLRLEELLKGL